jgi:hypothetical protein
LRGFLRCVAYQRPDSAVPLLLGNLQSSAPILSRQIDVGAGSKEALSHGVGVYLRRQVQRREAIILLKIDVTARCNQQLCDGCVAFLRCKVQRRCSIHVLHINITAGCKELLGEADTPVTSRNVHRCGAIILLAYSASGVSICTFVLVKKVK